MKRENKSTVEDKSDEEAWVEEDGFSESELLMDESQSENESENEDVPQKKKTKTDESQDPKKSRKEQKILTTERKSQKPNAPLIQQAKKIWEQLRQKKIEKSDRESLMAQMMVLVSGKCQDIIFKHDASRIIQCCLKYGNQKERDLIATELKGKYAELSKSQYGRFIVSKILNYCSPLFRNDIISEFYGKVRKIIRHKEAAIVLEEAYSQFANSAQRSALMEEFYGPEFALFKTKEGRSLQMVIDSNPLKKDSIVKHLGEVVNSVLEKGSSSIGQISIIHRAILEYLLYADEKSILDLIEILKDHLIHILHTREGARVVQLCLLHSGPKNRKHIVKSFKGFIHKISLEQYGHAVLITCFECVDDTVLVQKAIISELLKDGNGPEESALSLMRNKFGSRVILYLLMGRSKKYQPSYLIDELEEMDAIRSKTSKKDESQRKKELLEAISEPLIEKMELWTNELCRDKIGGQLLAEGIRHAIGDKAKLLLNLSQLTSGTVEEAFKKKSNEGFNSVKSLKLEADKARLEETIVMDDHILVNRNATFTLKDILSGGRASKDFVPINNQEFIKLAYAQIKPNLTSWVNYCASKPYETSGTSYVLLNMFENADDSIKKAMKKAIKSIGAEVDQVIAAQKEINKKKEPVVSGKNKRKQNQKPAQDSDRKLAIEVFLEALRS